MSPRARRNAARALTVTVAAAAIRAGWALAGYPGDRLSLAVQLSAGLVALAGLVAYALERNSGRP